MTTPEGSHRGPVIHHDRDGSYTVYVGKHCSHTGCGVQLTSRNREGHKLLCKAHARAMARERMAAKRNKGKPAKLGEPKAHEFFKLEPEKHAVHMAWVSWLMWPTEPGPTERLRAAMVDFELRYRLRLLLPDACPSTTPKPSIAIPAEEETFTNPEHRRTRNEFLSEAKAYGV
jgi:hypothetical protein